MEAFKGLYHADKLDETSFIHSFTIRTKEFSEIRNNLNQQKKKPLQHFLITGKRGMGKSTLLRRIHIEASRPPLSGKLLAVRLGAEQYRLSRLYKLWEMVIEQLCAFDTNLLERKKELEKSKFYQEGLLPLIIDYLNKKDKTLLLLIDNFDQFIEKIPGKDQHAFREALILYPIQVIGNTVFYNDHFKDYNSPFFDFFKPIHLGNLDRSEAEEFIKARAENEGIENFEEIIKKQRGKISALRILSGGVPRTLLILLSIVSRENTGDAIEYLHEMIELVTPLYQDRMKALSPQQQEIMHHLAMRWDRTPVKDLAGDMRIPSKSISAQLIQLEKSGYIKKIDVPGRNHYYEIDERFFNIWLLMSEAPSYDFKRVIWLTKWLDSFYSNEELKDFAGFCHTKLREIKPANRLFIIQALIQSKKLESEYKKHLANEIAVEFKDKMPEVQLWNNSVISESSKPPILSKIEIEELIEKSDHPTLNNVLRSINEPEKLDEMNSFFLKGLLYVIREDYTQAEHFFQLSAEKGHTAGMICLGMLAEMQNKVDVAEKLYLKAADKGNSAAMVKIGILYEERKDFDKAIGYYAKAVEAGELNAMLFLGNIYEKEKKDLLSAEKYYTMAVKNDNAAAMFVLGNFYEEIKKDLKNAEKYYLMAAERGEVDAMFNLGLLYLEMKDQSKAEIYFSKAVEQEDTDAMFNLGLFYEQEKKDLTTAEKYYLLAAEKGNIDAMVNLGFFYEEEKRDIANAEKYYLLAAEKGNIDAMVNLGYLYEEEKKDFTAAEKYYLMAAEKGDAMAMGNLSCLYFMTNSEAQKSKSLELINEAMEISNNNDIALKATNIEILLWNEKVSEAKILMTGLIEKSLLSDEDLPHMTEALQSFLIFGQKQFLYKLFTTTPDLIDRHKPIYYALLFLMKDEHLKEYLKMPTELEEPVKSVLENVNEMQEKLKL